MKRTNLQIQQRKEDVIDWIVALATIFTFINIGILIGWVIWG